MTTNTTLERFRSILLTLIVLGLVGIGSELLLLGHIESWTQLIPLVMIAAALAVIGWHYTSPGDSTVRALKLVMGAFVVTGLIGIGLHFWSNVEFELEMYPNIEGMDLFKRSLSGAMPALAPGSMIQLGLLGLLYTFRYPPFMEEEEL
jgi:hypothetical protein